MLIGIVGQMSAATPPSENPLIPLKKERVQSMLLDLNESPVPRSFLLQKYADIAQDIEQLLLLGALKDDGSRAQVNFCLLNRRDREIVLEVAATHAKELSARLRSLSSQLRHVLSNYGNPCVSQEKLTFMILGCYFLDWNSLAIMKAWNAMNFEKPQAAGNRYTLWGEDDVSTSLKAVYWGGHSETAGRYLLHTFGDHDPQTVRGTYPDILWMTGSRASFPGRDKYQMLLREKQLELASEACRVFECIGKQGTTERELCERLGSSVDKTSEFIAFLHEVGYVEQSGSRVNLAVPYFVEDDADLLMQAQLLLLPILRDWCVASVSQLERDLGSISPLRNGVPFKEVFVQVWHYIFGLTNKFLASDGLIYDTYAASSSHRGYMPAVALESVLDACRDRLVSVA